MWSINVYTQRMAGNDRKSLLPSLQINLLSVDSCLDREWSIKTPTKLTVLPQEKAAGTHPKKEDANFSSFNRAAPSLSLPITQVCSYCCQCHQMPMNSFIICPDSNVREFFVCMCDFHNVQEKATLMSLLAWWRCTQVVAEPLPVCLNLFFSCKCFTLAYPLWKLHVEPESPASTQGHKPAFSNVFIQVFWAT